MLSQKSDKQEGRDGTAKPKRCGVILLTDNRDLACGEREGQEIFRCSGFKQTEVDPLQFERNQLCRNAEEQLLSRLSRRVEDLQERVRSLMGLNDLESTSKLSQKASQAKKSRRKFNELVRDHECKKCGKWYGSGTALKHHQKIKHSLKQEQESDGM